ncbi:1-phosphofructokinase [Salinicola rhizosphaerae]|uniref:Phosphofructokinase n=1 Tax=Salinicola rhizosphaerae TaxID=1443141 RepID=A0ABQ3DXG8_9GAMM|nr:1-phosphofructokinase [Salinicola rhizosphaerae]GHB19465.1 phosphofructokinase [Salinicola rhizosphaerae]
MAHVVVVTLNPALDLSIRLSRLEPGAVNRTLSTQLEAAGKGLNVARVLVALGHQVTLSGFLGADNDGAFVDACRRTGIDDASLRLPGETRINAKLAEADGRVTDINGPGLEVPPSALKELTASLLARVADESPDALVVTGSLPPGVTPAAFGDLLRALGAAAVPLWVDTSGPALLEALNVPPTGAKPNEHELAEWAGDQLDDADARLAAARRLHAAGVEEALLSLGGDGVIWVSRRGIFQARPPSVAVVSTVGAGDTLLAAMLHGVLGDHAPTEALRFATALGAEAVRHLGVGDPHAEDFSALYQQTIVSELDACARVGGNA